MFGPEFTPLDKSLVVVVVVVTKPAEFVLAVIFSDCSFNSDDKLVKAVPTLRPSLMMLKLFVFDDVDVKGLDEELVKVVTSIEN